MENFLAEFYEVLGKPTYFLLIFIGVYVVSATIDFMLGGFIASIKSKEEDIFSTRTMQLGIVRKLGTMFVMILVVPVALTLPFEIGIYSLTILYIGIVTSEIYSVLGHIGIVKDGNKGKKAIGKVFSEILDATVKHKKG